MRGRHASAGTGGTAAAPARHRAALVPPDKGDGGPRRVEDAGARGAGPSTGAFHGAAFPRGDGMREVPERSIPGKAKEKLPGEQAGRGRQENPEGFCAV